ncbi:unnamed protein product [Urochloa humidicola]
MARKRKGVQLEEDMIDVDSSQESDDFKFEDERGSDCDKLSDACAKNIYSYVGAEDSKKHATYKELMKDYADIKIMKRKLALALTSQGNNAQQVKKKQSCF